MLTREFVVLLDDGGEYIGTALKSEVHGSDTPLHLAFSCYVMNQDDQLLVTRRALSKLTWPGVWTNSFCGHPAPGEDLKAAVVRRANQELGAVVTSVECVLPDFRYRAVDAGGIVENEICPVFLAKLEGSLHPVDSEVSEWAWVDAADLNEAVKRAPFAFSPWMGEQLPLLQGVRGFEELT